MKAIKMSMALLTVLLIGFTGCSNKKEDTASNENAFKNFAKKPQDTSADDRSPIRYQK
jgi:hypothetical protein